MIRHIVGVVLSLAFTAGIAVAEEPASETPGNEPLSANAAELSKKETELRADAARPPISDAQRAAWHKSLARRIGKAPAKLINIANLWTRENLVVPASGRRGSLEAEDVNTFLRCRYTNKPTAMDTRLLPAAIDAARHFGSPRIVIVSGYRSPKYNLVLIKKMREVSRRSQHTHGKALDFRLDGVSAADLRDWAKRLHMGGVGYYERSGFVHIDTARVRYWNGR